MIKRKITITSDSTIDHKNDTSVIHQRKFVKACLIMIDRMKIHGGKKHQSAGEIEKRHDKVDA